MDVTDKNVRFDLKIAIPQKKNEDGSANGDVCVYIPKDVEAWKKSLEKHLDGEGVMYLSLTDNGSSEFSLILSEFPDADIIGGMEDGKLFGINMERSTLEALNRAIQFALQENDVSKKPE